MEQTKGAHLVLNEINEIYKKFFTSSRVIYDVVKVNCQEVVLVAA